MKFVVRCLYCDKRFTVPEAGAGRRGNCPCGHSILFPKELWLYCDLTEETLDLTKQDSSFSLKTFKAPQLQAFVEFLIEQIDLEGVVERGSAAQFSQSHSRSPSLPSRAAKALAEEVDGRCRRIERLKKLEKDDTVYDGVEAIQLQLGLKLRQPNHARMTLWLEIICDGKMVFPTLDYSLNFRRGGNYDLFSPPTAELEPVDCTDAEELCSVYCPNDECRREHSIQKSQMSTVLRCENPDCATRFGLLRIPISVRLLEKPANDPEAEWKYRHDNFYTDWLIVSLSGSKRYKVAFHESVGENRFEDKALDLSSLPVLAQFPSIDTLEMSQHVRRKEHAILKGLSHLRGLEIWGKGRNEFVLADDDFVIAHLAGWTNLCDLEFRGSVSDGSLVKLGELPSLQNLYISGDELLGPGLAHYPHPERLRCLTLYGLDHMPPDSMRQLARFINLRKLSLGGESVTNRSLSVLSNLTKLEELDLSFANIGDRGLAHLAELPNLQVLDLGWTDVTGKGFAHLTGLNRLRELSLQNCSRLKGKNALQYIREITSLKKLVLSYGSNIPDAAQLDIKTALPDCWVKTA